MKTIDRPTKRALIRRKHPIAAVIVHTTGETDLEKCLRFYTAPDGLGPHYAIGLDGTVYRTANEGLVAYHAKIDDEEAKLYRLGWDSWKRWFWKNDRPEQANEEYPGYASWRDTWLIKGKKSPLDLVTGEQPNARSVGIELLQPKVPEPKIFTEDQYLALVELTLDIAERQGLILSRETCLGHYDVSPMRRSTRKGGWDPGEKFDWAGFLAALVK